jgi:hypothetical protein
MKISTFVIVPASIYEKGEIEVKKYVDELMIPYSEDFEMDPHVIATAEEVNNEYAEFCEDYVDKNEFCEKIFGGHLDENGCVVSTINTDAFWETYKIGLKKYEIDDVIDFEKTFDCIAVKTLMESIIYDSNIDVVLSENTVINKKNEPMFNEKVNILLRSNENEYCLYVECQI